MLHYLNICDIKGGVVPPVDIITFGSPCQDLSVAGKRAGLKHKVNGDEETTRSGLVMEAVRIIKEMRRATNGKYPTYALWENVPGAFSSNKGEDFRVVVEELAKIADETVSIPAPPRGKWATSGYVDGDDWSLAWRVVDAQYHGVPQRRRRILLVADFGGKRAGKISFECEGLPGYPPPSGDTRQAAPGNAPRGAGANGRDGDVNRGGGRLDGVTIIDSVGGQSEYAKETEVNGTLRACGQGCVAYALQGGGATSQNSNGPGWKEDISYTLNTTDCHGVAYTDLVISGKGALIQTEKSATLGVSQDQTLFQPVGAGGLDCDQVSHTLISGMSSAVGTTQDNLIVTQPVAYGVDCRNIRETDEVYGTLQAKPNGGQSLNYSGAVRTGYIVRRLTPTECARLQGFPDDWGQIGKKDDFTDEEMDFWNAVYVTHQLVVKGREVPPKTKPQLLNWYNKLWTDSAEYKMWGNGVALPCVRVPIHNMAKYGAKTLASLFDGSGGFPLAGMMEGIDPIWCSEIEPYPIAVTMERFPECEDDWLQ